MAAIESNCEFKLSDRDNATVSDCKTAAKALINETEFCNNRNQPIEWSCNCFNELSTDNLDKVISCDISTNNMAAKEAKKNCTKSMNAAKPEDENVNLFL